MRQWLAESRCECQTRRSGTSGDYDRPVVTLADPGNMLTTHKIASLLRTTEAFIRQIPEEKQDATMRRRDWCTDVPRSAAITAVEQPVSR